MWISRRGLLKLYASALLAGATSPAFLAGNVRLPSWNKGPAKKTILNFVHSKTDGMSSKLALNRIAARPVIGTDRSRSTIRWTRESCDALTVST